MHVHTAPEKVVIFTAPFGNGHTAAATSIRIALLSTWPDADVRVVDLTEKIYKRIPLQKWLRSYYRFATNIAGGMLQSAMYRLFDAFPVPLSLMTNALWGRRASRYLSSLGHIDIAISTFPTVAFVLRCQLSARTPLVVHVTDAGRVNRIWFAPKADKFLVIDDHSAAVAKSCGIPANLVTVVGPPLYFDGRYPAVMKQDARTRLGLADEFTVLFTAGGAGLGQGVLRAATAVASAKLPVQAILNAGDNRRLAARFARLQFASRPILVGMANDLKPLIAASDLVVGKAGTMTLAEAASIGTPTLIVGVVPGHEPENAVRAAQGYAARVVPSSEVVNDIQRYVNDRTSMSADFQFDASMAILSRWSKRVVDSVGDALRSR